jgi:hypothetical protein
VRISTYCDFIARKSNGQVKCHQRQPAAVLQASGSTALVDGPSDVCLQLLASAQQRQADEMLFPTTDDILLLASRQVFPFFAKKKIKKCNNF